MTQSRTPETPASIHLSPYAHSVAWGIVRGEGTIELLPQFEAQIIDFEYDGEPKQTAGIFDLEKERAEEVANESFIYV
jgi:hypothetical protein